MTLKSYLWGMRISAALTLAAWILVLGYVDPEKSGLPGLLLFYTSMLLFLSSMFILFFTWLRKKSGDGEEAALVYLGVSFRQGILMALLAVVLLILQQQRVLTWWDSALVMAGVLLLELYFLTRK